MKTLSATLIITITGITRCFSQDTPVNYFEFISQGEQMKMAYRYQKVPGSKGSTIVLLHGKNFSSAYWLQTLKALVNMGYDVLAPEQVGFGHSTMPVKYQYSFQQLAFNTSLLLDFLKIDQAVVLGHSIGGMLAVRFALMYPKRCSQLILESPIGLEDWKLKVSWSSVDSEYKKELGKTKQSIRQYMLQNYFHNEWKPAYDSLLHDASVNAGQKDVSWSMALTTDMLFNQPVLYEFGSIKMPTVLMVGSLDRTAPGKERADSATAASMGDYPTLAKKTAASIPGCRLMLLEGIGHIPHIEDFPLFMKKLSNALLTNDVK